MPAHSKKTPAITTAILDRLSKGEPLAQICRDEGMPDSSTWRDWCAADEALGIAYARARDEGFDAIALDSLQIMDAQPERYMTELGERIDPASVAWAKSRAEQRLKLLAKWDPKRYGDKITQEHTGADGGPIETRGTLRVEGLSDAALAEVAALQVGPEKID